MLGTRMQASRGVASKAPGCTPARQQFMRRARSVTARNSPMQSADYASSLGKDQYLVIVGAHLANCVSYSLC
eukprot:1152999-Pelagomonas_calceolata.AAC.1